MVRKFRRRLMTSSQFEIRGELILLIFCFSLRSNGFDTISLIYPHRPKPKVLELISRDDHFLKNIFFERMVAFCRAGLLIPAGDHKLLPLVAHFFFLQELIEPNTVQHFTDADASKCYQAKLNYLNVIANIAIDWRVNQFQAKGNPMHRNLDCHYSQHVYKAKA
jgi:hypothetical protein